MKNMIIMIIIIIIIQYIPIIVLFIIIIVLSKRQEQLVYNKKYHPDYIGNHPNPIWRISQATLSALCTERLQLLSLPKQLHSDYELSRPVHACTCTCILRCILL